MSPASSPFKLDSLQREIAYLSEFVLTSMTGRNVFTQPDEIIARINELLDAKTAAYSSMLSEFTATAHELGLSGSTESSKLKSCVKEVEESVT